jgi:radical SAM protein with 4Fe4S-binding SPASM domain
LPPPEARIAFAGLKKRVVDAYAQRPDRFELNDSDFVDAVARLQARGVLDDDFRCQAHLVPRDFPASTAINGPLVTHLQLTLQCNLECPHCYVPVTKKAPPGEIGLEHIDALFSDLSRMGAPVVVMAGGEPLLRRDLPEILELVKENAMDAWLCTNATLIKGEMAELLAGAGLRGISVSLDGGNAEKHDRLRGIGRFEKALEGTRRLIDAGSDIVELRVTVTGHNKDTLADLAPVATELGVKKVVFKPFRKTGVASSEPWVFISRGEYLEAIERVHALWPQDAVPMDTGDGIPRRMPDWTGVIPAFGCVGGNTSVTVTNDGRITGCGPVQSPADWNLKTHSFLQAWHHAPTLGEWRHLEGNATCSACGNYQTCGGGCRARALGKGWGMNEPDPWSHCSLEGQGGSKSALPVL